MKSETIEEIATSWINGNKSWVQNKVKRMSKLDFVYLIVATTSQDSRGDIEEVAHALLRK